MRQSRFRLEKPIQAISIFCRYRTSPTLPWLSRTNFNRIRREARLEYFGTDENICIRGNNIIERKTEKQRPPKFEVNKAPSVYPKLTSPCRQLSQAALRRRWWSTNRQDNRDERIARVTFVILTII